MGRKTIVGVIAIVAIVAAVILCGCIDEITQPTPSPATTPSSSFEIEYPVTAYFETEFGSGRVTLYEDGSASGKASDIGNFYGEWTIEGTTKLQIEYRVGIIYGDGSGAMYFALCSNHVAILDPGPHPTTVGYWK